MCFKLLNFYFLFRFIQINILMNMKKILLLIIILAPMLSYSQKTYVPDDIFEAWLEGNGYGDSIAYNDSVLTSSIEVISYLNIQNKQISDYTGIESMINLNNLYINDNPATILNLRNIHLLHC